MDRTGPGPEEPVPGLETSLLLPVVQTLATFPSLASKTEWAKQWK